MERAGVLALAALAPLAMLAVDPGGWFPFGPVKWALVSTLVLAGTALLLAGRPLRSPELVRGLLGVLVGWLAVAAVVGEDPLYAWLGTPERRFGVVTWGLCALALLAGRTLDVRVHGPVVLGGLLLAGLGVGAVATAEALGFEPDVLDVGTRLTGTFGSSAYLGAATALLLPVAVGTALGEGPGRRRLLAAAATAGLTVACLGSGARAAWLGLVAAAVVAAAATGRELWWWLRRRPLLSTAGAVLLAGGLVAVVVLSPVASRVAAIDDEGAPGGRGRLDEWRIATDVALERLPFGAGPEGYRIAFAEGVDLDYVQDHGRDELTDRAHSGPLDVLLAGGLPVVVTWAVLALLVARSALSLLRSGPGWLRGLSAGLVAHGVGQLAFFPVMELEPVVWLVAGLVLAARPRALLHGTPTIPDRRDVPRFVPIGLGVVAAVALVAGATEVVADHRARAAVDALADGDTGRALAEADDAAALRPDVLRLHLLAARAAVADGQGALAGLERVDDALAVSGDDPVALLERARLLVVRAEATGTRAHRDAARTEVGHRLAADPLHPELWRLAARVADLDGDTAAAGAARARARELEPRGAP